MERKFSVLCSLFSQAAGHFCLPSHLPPLLTPPDPPDPPPTPPDPPSPSCNLHYFTEWGTVSRALAAYENQAMVLLCCHLAPCTFSLALPFPVRLPEKREKITPVLWDRFIYLFYLFTSFSGHRPAQRECARRGLIGPMQSAIPTQSHNP